MLQQMLIDKAKGVNIPLSQYQDKNKGKEDEQK